MVHSLETLGRLNAEAASQKRSNPAYIPITIYQCKIEGILYEVRPTGYRLIFEQSDDFKSAPPAVGVLAKNEDGSWSSMTGLSLGEKATVDVIAYVNKHGAPVG